MNILKNKAVKWMLIVIAAIIIVIAVYISYLFLSYKRIPDNQILEIQNASEEYSSNRISTSKEYIITTSNIGFGAYSQDFTFFMDGGKESVGRSKAEVTKNIEGSAELISSFNPDFALFQEADLNSTRSYHVNQYDILKSTFNNESSIKAINYDSAFLFYPFIKPHGKSLAATATFSKYQIEDAVRRSLPIAEDFNKFFDLDRCYSVASFTVDNGKKLYIYNVHLSAYGGNPQIRTAQMTMLFNDMKKKAEAGDYIICGGDFNHDMLGNSLQLLNKAEDLEFEWTHPFPFDMMPNIFKVCTNYNSKELIPTARNCKYPYVKGESIVFIIDGFIVSNNVSCESVDNIDNQFLYSDHNPVLMKFKLI